MTKLTLAFLALFTLTGATRAHAAGEVSLVGAGNCDRLNPPDHDQSFCQKAGIGGGILFESRSPGVGLEFGALYIRRNFEEAAGNQDQITAIQLAALLRFHLADWLSFGIGGFYENYIGNLKVSGSDVGSYQSNSLATSNYGPAGSVALRIPLAASTHFLLDGRYLYGLKQQFTEENGNRAKFKDVQLLVGLQFGM